MYKPEIPAETQTPEIRKLRSIQKQLLVGAPIAVPIRRESELKPRSSALHTDTPSKTDGEIFLQFGRYNLLLRKDGLTPFWDGATAGIEERTTWQTTPVPKIMRIMTPVNSAAASRIICLELCLSPPSTFQAQAYRYFHHQLGSMTSCLAMWCSIWET